jgi:phage baseplate assembly protein W
MSQRCIALPFTFTAAGEVGYTTDYKKIYQDRVISVIMSLYNERVMVPTFGTAARTSVFETESEAESIVVSEVRAGFSKWLPDLVLNKVEVLKPEDGTLEFTVTYKLPTNEDDVVSIKYGLFTRSGDAILEGLSEY